MKTIKLRFNLSWLTAFLVLGLVSCKSNEELIKAQFDALPQIDSTLLYEYSAVSSSATGKCVSTFDDRWYGTALSVEDVEKLYSDYLANNGWSVWPDEVVEIWSLESEDGLYRVGTARYTQPNDISQQQASYQLPDSVLQEATHFQTVYLVSMTYSSPYAAKKCFER